MSFLNTFLAIFAFIFLAVIAMNIGFLLKKREFRGSCSSRNPMLADKFGACPVCGSKAEEACELPEARPAK
ncbi:MAG: hypothetical protein EPO28_04775 [Saprospiraceae bacterium]|nr:MAG: hypothetical protein EPO28_04775 [Saprospiraceae bacterium]